MRRLKKNVVQNLTTSEESRFIEMPDKRDSRIFGTKFEEQNQTYLSKLSSQQCTFPSFVRDNRIGVPRLLGTIDTRKNTVCSERNEYSRNEHERT